MLNINKGLRGGSSHEQRVISTMVVVSMLDTELLSIMVANKQGEGKKHGGSSHSQHKQRVIISYGDKQGEEKEHDGSSHAELFSVMMIDDNRAKKRNMVAVRILDKRLLE